MNTAPLSRFFTRWMEARTVLASALLCLSLAWGQAMAYTVYVSSEKDNTITVLDGESLEVLDTVDVGQRPRGIVLSKDGKYLYVCTSDDDH
ncbi:MAG TPA: beta-propeller fold lactonase family protein, partial [Arenicellales bacterium]|nr:beta-propeller fold lactonase family protein [Arenicellales bacterium]